VGWAEPYPTLSSKRPTASLVSRKVLTPLLGQIFIAFALQFICYKAAEAQPWYIPPVPLKNKANVPNSANTTLFLVSCYQYIFAAVFLSVGKPYRQPMRYNYPFMATVLIGVAVSTYMLFFSPRWLVNIMQLTPMPLGFKFVLLGAAAVGFVVSYLGEQKLFPRLARLLGETTKGKKDGEGKTRKKYKVLEEQMRF
jgi:cation-transporting ATPase 13A2